MKKKISENFDSNGLDALKTALTNEAAPLPEELCKENIVELVSGKKQKTPKRKTVRRFVSVAVAACIVICSLVILDGAVYAPKIKVPQNSVAYAKSYSELSSLMKEYFKTAEFKQQLTFNNFLAEKEETAMDSRKNTETNYSTTADDAGKQSYSETNLREAGIYEADTVKTDGTYLYALHGNNFFIVKADDLTLVSRLYLDTKDYADNRKQWNDFYLIGNTLVFEISGYKTNDATHTVQSFAGAELYDIADKAKPVKIKETSFDGSLVSSRVTENKLVLITSYRVYDKHFSAEDYKTFLPAVYNGEESSYPQADDIVIADTEKPDSFITVSVFDLNEPESEPELLTVFGGGRDVYCTADTLYVYNTDGYSGFIVLDDFFSSRSYSPETNIISFDISGDKPSFIAKGCVDGYVLNTWALDEYNGYLRVAAVKNSTYVYVLDRELKQVGKSEGLAKGEQIKSVRFTGDTAYIVTFLQTDPLFVLDLSNPKAPKVKGELKLPGFSDYLHPVGDKLLMGVGVDGTDAGTNSNAKLSLFDVSDAENPREISSLIIDDARFFHLSHKAFVTVGDGTFIIPVMRYRFKTVQTDGYNSYYQSKEEKGAVRVGIKDGELQLLAQYTLKSAENVDWVRAMFIGKTAYLVNPVWCYDTPEPSCKLCVSTFDLDSGEQSAENAFDCVISNKYFYGLLVD